MRVAIRARARRALPCLSHKSCTVPVLIREGDARAERSDTWHSALPADSSVSESTWRLMVCCNVFFILVFSSLLFLQLAESMWSSSSRVAVCHWVDHLALLEQVAQQPHLLDHAAHEILPAGVGGR